MELKGRDRKVKPDMDWNESTKPFVSQSESSLKFFYNYSNNPYPGVEMKQPAMGETSQRMLPAMDNMMNYGNREKKKRLTGEQIELLERSFQEEIKLDPERKMKLSRELGLQPRQIAIWFQNRRTRWKAKHLEHLYDELKHEFDVVSKEKHKLQQEVMKLKARLRDQTIRTQTVGGYAEISAEETVDSTSEALAASNIQQVATEGNGSFTVEDYNNNSVSLSHCHHQWPVMPYYYP